MVLPQLPTSGTAVAAIDGSPVLERPQLVIRVVMRVRVVSSGRGGVRSRRAGGSAGAGQENRRGRHTPPVARHERHDLLDADLVAPGEVEVVLVGETLAHPKAERGQAHLMRVVGEGHPTSIGDAVALGVNDEAVQVGIGPAEGELDGGVKLGDSRFSGDQQAAPDQRADSVEPDAELVDNRWVGGGHTTPCSTEATGQGAVPSRERRETARRGDYTGNE